MGKLLFLENTYNHVYYPISEISKRLRTIFYKVFSMMSLWLPKLHCGSFWSVTFSFLKNLLDYWIKSTIFCFCWIFCNGYLFPFLIDSLNRETSFFFPLDLSPWRLMQVFSLASKESINLDCFHGNIVPSFTNSMIKIICCMQVLHFQLGF